MGLDDGIVLFDAFGNWYLTLELNPKADKRILINQVTNSLREHLMQSKLNEIEFFEDPHWNKSNILVY